MSSTMIVERPASVTTGLTAAAAPNVCMVPKCTITAEKCAGGLKLHCRCEDETACLTLQNLCQSLGAQMCCCNCTWNGVTVCQCNLCCGNCKCEATPDGVCITCTSGDKACCDMLQACCDTIACCLEAGCTCCVCFGNTPVCCGCCCE